MHVSAPTRELMVKVLRIFLVFTLVFWGTFRIETIAFADDEASGTENTETVEEDDDANSDPSPTDQPGTDQPGADQPGAGGDGNTEGGGTGGGEGTTGEGGGTQPITPTQPEQPAVTVPSLQIHLLDENPPASKTGPLREVGQLVRGSKETAPQGFVPEINTLKGELRFIAVIDGERVAGNDQVEWNVEGESAQVVEFTKDSAGKNTNVLKAKGDKDSNAVKVSCKLKPETLPAGLPADTTVKVEFEVRVTNQASAYIKSIEILDADGETHGAGETLSIDLKTDDSVSYQFSARVTVRDSATSSSETAERTLVTTDADGLGDRDKKLLESLEWTVSDVDGVAIDSTGLFKASEKAIVMVTCSSPLGPNDFTVIGRVMVNTGLEVDAQGLPYPQNSLLVQVPSSVVRVAESDEGDDEKAEPETLDKPVDPDQQEAAQQENDEKPEVELPADIKKTYSLEDLASLPWTTGTYTLQGRMSGFDDVLGADDNTTTITGTGPQLLALLEDAGADLSKAASVTFVNYQGDTRTVSLSALMSSGDSEAFLAASSLVHTKDLTGEPGVGDLLENTRFRLLLGNGATLDSALSGINTVRVNGDGSGDGSGGNSDSSLRAVIGYVPVAMGYTTSLSAIVVGSYQGETFGWEWEVSNDGGVSWSVVASTPKIDVVTDAASIRSQYRATVNTSYGRTAISEPITIVENTGFSVALDYVPPRAGDMAIFTTSVSGIDARDILPEGYIWEWTEDGGVTWQEIANSRGNPTFMTKTDPIDSSGGGGNGSGDAGDGNGAEGESGDGTENGDGAEEVDTTPAPSIWIHVRVLATEGREAVSNPVMLTVHVSDDGGSGQPMVDEPTDEIPENPDAPGTDNPVTPPEEEEKPAEPASGPTITEVDSIVMETAPRGQSSSPVVTASPATEQTPDGTETTPTPISAASGAPTELVVNPAITAEILDQQAAVDAAIQASRPGARWTALTTVDPDGKDVQRILSDNPFAPLTAPFALGLTAAGAVEKLLTFRRQTR